MPIKEEKKKDEKNKNAANFFGGDSTSTMGNVNVPKSKATENKTINFNTNSTSNIFGDDFAEDDGFSKLLNVDRKGSQNLPKEKPNKNQSKIINDLQSNKLNHSTYSESKNVNNINLNESNVSEKNRTFTTKGVNQGNNNMMNTLFNDEDNHIANNFFTGNTSSNKKDIKQTIVNKNNPSVRHPTIKNDKKAEAKPNANKVKFLFYLFINL